MNLDQAKHWSNSYEIEILTTSLIEILELPNFDHKTVSTI